MTRIIASATPVAARGVIDRVASCNWIAIGRGFATSPVAGAGNVAVGAIVTAQFSEPVEPTTVTTSTVTLTPAGGSPVAASVTYDGPTATARLTPSAALVFNMVYTANVNGVRDPAGNTAPQTSWTFTTVPPPTIQTFVPTADAYVEERKPSQNRGAATALHTDGGVGSRKESYLTFVVSGVPGTFSSVKLRLWMTNGSTNGPELYTVDPAAWAENGVTWTNKPTPGPQIGNAGNVPTGAWYEFDVTSTVTGNGTFSFDLASVSTDAVRFDSREGVNKPQLVIDWDAP